MQTSYFFSFSTYCTILLSYFPTVSECSQKYFPFSEIKHILKQQSPNTDCRPVHVLYRITICPHVHSQCLVSLTNNQNKQGKERIESSINLSSASTSNSLYPPALSTIPTRFTILSSALARNSFTKKFYYIRFIYIIICHITGTDSQYTGMTA